MNRKLISTADRERSLGRLSGGGSKYPPAAVLLLGFALLAGCAGTPPNRNPRAQDPLVLAPHVDLDAFMGRWYVIANIPYFGERGYVGSYVEYKLRPDGDIDDIFFGRKGDFTAPVDRKNLKDRVVDRSTNAQWRASPFWPVSFPYLILYVDPAYQYALIGYPDKELGWVFSRSPDMPDDVYRSLMSRFDSQGYDVSRFSRVPQRPQQVGLPGFQSP